MNSTNPTDRADVTALLKAKWPLAVSITQHLDDVLAAVPNPDEEAYPYDKYIPINQQRARRVRKQIAEVGLREDVLEAVSRVVPGTRMLVLNEVWCGDGAQILPVHEAMEQASGGRLEIRVLMRDSHLDMMDLFLTNGGRAIPKTVLLNESMHVLGSWGPRPQEAMDLVKRIKSDPAIAHTYGSAVHKWYAEDKQQNIQRELAVFLGHAQGA